MYNSTLSLTSALDGGGWSTPRPGRFTPGKDPVPIVWETGWASGPGAENLAPTGIRSLGRPACSQSLYRLSYPCNAPLVTNAVGNAAPWAAELDTLIARTHSGSPTCNCGIWRSVCCLAYSMLHNAAARHTQPFVKNALLQTHLTGFELAQPPTLMDLLVVEPYQRLQ